MTDLSNYLENALLDHVYGGTAYSPPSTLYLRLYSTVPNYETGSSGVELSGSGYNPIAITNNSTNFPSATNGSKSNGVAIVSDTATGSWSVQGYALCDASSGGNILIGKILGSTLTVNPGESFRFNTGTLTIAFSGFSNYLNSKLCDLVFGNVSYTAPATHYFGLFTAAPNFQTGSGGTEVSGSNYSRASATNNSTNFPNASSGSKSNGTAITFSVPSAGWGTVTSYGVYDAVSSGNFLGGANFASSQSIVSGTAPIIQIGAFTATLG